MSCFHGIELSMNAGVDLAIGDFVFEFDSTILDFPPDEIMHVYRKSLEGFDIVSAGPKKRQRTSSVLFYEIFNRFSDSNYKFKTERFRILSRRVINRISNTNRSVPYRKAVYANQGLRTASFLYDALKIQNGKKDRALERYRKTLAVDALIIFTDLGYKVAVLLSFCMIFFSVAISIYSFVYRMLKNPVAGWTSTILFLAVVFFFLFLILAVIIKYLQILVNLVFKRSKYNFESIEKLK